MNNMDFAYYGYNASNTRTYKISMLNANTWVNGQPEPLNLQLQNAMFYPNAYLNFNHNGEYTKHYYNGTERICSCLGENFKTIAVTVNGRLQSRIARADALFRSQIGELVFCEEPDFRSDRSGGGIRNLVSPTVEYAPVTTLTSLNPTGNPDDIFYYHINHLGSTAFVTDQNQNVTQGFLYAPFGEITTEYAPLWQNGTLPKYAFNAKELDEETGMYYYEARYYKPPVFTSRDPMMDQKPWLSPYHYCSNNPVGRVDPSGCDDAWVKTSNGVIFDSDVHVQADAVKRYGNDASILPYGSHKINGKDVYLSYNGKYIINGKNYYARDCASFFTRFAKFFEEGHSDGANMGRITKEDLQKGIPIVFSIISFGSTLEAVAAKKVFGAIISGLGCVSSIDDACADSEGVTPLEKYAGGDYPIVIQTAKVTVDVLNVYNGANSLIKQNLLPADILNTATSSVSTVKDVKKMLTE